MRDLLRLPDGSYADPARVRVVLENYTTHHPPGFLWVVHEAGGDVVVYSGEVRGGDLNSLALVAAVNLLFGRG